MITPNKVFVNPSSLISSYNGIIVYPFGINIIAAIQIMIVFLPGKSILPRAYPVSPHKIITIITVETVIMTVLRK